MLFHVGCPFTGRGVCQCVHGTPPSLHSASAAAKYAEQAREVWDFWQDPGKALGRDEPVEVLLPRLVKVERLVRKPYDNTGEHGLPTRKEAERAFQAATRLAELSTLKAARLAAAAGLEFIAPEGLGLELPDMEKVDYTELEVALEAAGASSRKLAAAAAEVQHQRAVGPAGSEGAAGYMLGQGSRATPARSGSTALHGGVEGRSSSRQAARAAVAAAAAAAAGQVGGSAAELDAMALVGPARPLQVKIKPSSPNEPAGKATKATTSSRSPAQAAQVDMSAFPEGYSLRGPSTKHPPKAWCLKIKDYKPSLAGEMVQLYWPDDGQWWPAMVISVSGTATERKCTLYYETGDEETTDLTPLIRAGEVAWLLGPGSGNKPAAPSASEDARSAGQAHTGGASGSKRAGRREPGAGPESGGESTDDEEDPVILRLRNVTKRQRQAAAAAASRRSGAGPGAGAGASSASGGALNGGSRLPGGAEEPALQVAQSSALQGPLASQLSLLGSEEAGAGAMAPFSMPGAGSVGVGLAGASSFMTHFGLQTGPSFPEQQQQHSRQQVAAQPGGALAPGGQGRPASDSAMRQLLAHGAAAVGRTVQLQLGSIQQPFYGVVADVLPDTQQVRVQLGGRCAALDARDEGVKFLIRLA